MGLFPEWTWIVGFAIGAAIGSFLNVVIYRMPLGMSLSEPKNSFCPNCKHQLGVPDLVPLLSWLFLRGKCRHCKVPVPPRYFIVELITGSLWGGIWFQYLTQGNDPIRAVGFMLGASILVAAIFIDLRWYIIPDQLNAWLFVIGVAMNGVQIALGLPGAWMWGMPASIAGALVGWGVLWGITLLGRLLFGKDAMGHGDIKLARGMGALLFPLGAGIAFALAIVLGAVIGTLQILLRKAPKVETPEDAEPENEEPCEPESISSIFKCGLGYLLLFDIIGLVIPKFYQSWFGEDPYATEDTEDDGWEPGFSTIPFGPYLAAGALVVMLAESTVKGWVQGYMNWVFGS